MARTKSNRTIYKYEFKVDDVVEIEIPSDRHILSVGIQKPNYICLWAIVDPLSRMDKVTLYVRETGHPLGDIDGDCFIGTVFDGPYVWHVFKEF